MNELVFLKELGKDIFKNQLRLQVGHVWDSEGFLGMGKIEVNFQGLDIGADKADRDLVVLFRELLPQQDLDSLTV